MSVLTIVILADTVLVLRGAAFHSLQIIPSKLHIVYALYADNRYVKWLVGILYAIEIIMMILGVFMGVPYIEVDDICLATNMPWTYLFFL